MEQRHYRDDVHDLRKMFKVGQLFGISDVQRKMVWGYNRARMTIDFAISVNDAEQIHQDGLYQKYQFIKF